MAAKAIKIDEFNRVCRLAGLMEIKASVPTWITMDRLEGLELKINKILTFHVKEGTRIYDQPVDDHRISSVLGAFEKELKEMEDMKNKQQKEEKVPDKKKEEEKTEQSPKAQELEMKKQEVHENALLPDFLTSALMTKWAQMPTMDRVLMFQRTPATEIYQIAVGKNPETGKQEIASYVKGNFMFREANAAFLFDWHLDIKEITTSATGVSVRGILFAWFSEYNKYLSRPATGYQELNKKIDVQQAIKGATTDAIKKGLSLFGFNCDVYSGEV